MIGLLLSQKETAEVEYMLKREMEELLLDLTDSRIDRVVKQAMEEKYQVVFGIYKRFVTSDEQLKYMLPRQREKFE